MNPRDVLEGFVAEDLSGGDPTGDLLSDVEITARMVSRERGVVSGVAHAVDIFSSRGCACRAALADGDTVDAGGLIMTISGMAADVLARERTALNLVSRMSGIATKAADLASRLPDGVRLLSTRKTAPGLRLFDKEAVEAGGGFRHRMTLGEMIMIKDNHVAAEGSLERLVRKAKERGGRFEVEVDTTQDALLAARLGAPVILLDNFEPAEIREAVSALEQEDLRGDVELEASGGITVQNIAEYGRSGVDCVSVGSMTSSVRGLDLSLEI